MKLRAPFRYWGAKVRMAPWIVERLPDHTHFVEACAGSAAVLAVKPRVLCETVNDTYGEVVNFFRVLRDREKAADLIDMVTFTPYSLAEFQDAAETLEVTEDPVERAWAFFVRMQMAVVPGRTGWSYSVNGAAGAKANKPGRWATMPELLRLAAERFERVQVANWDVCDLIGRLDAPGICIFVDPPYLGDSRPRSLGSSSAYQHDAFDHEALVAAVQASRHASFALTHYPHEFYDAAFPDHHDFSSHRNIPNGGGRDVQVERLYIVDRDRA